MDLDLLRRGFRWFGESDPMAVVWCLAAPTDEDDDEDEDSYSRGGDADDDGDVYDEDEDDDDEDDGHDAGDTLWAGGREVRQQS